MTSLQLKELVYALGLLWTGELCILAYSFESWGLNEIIVSLLYRRVLLYLHLCNQISTMPYIIYIYIYIYIVICVYMYRLHFPA